MALRVVLDVFTLDVPARDAVAGPALGVCHCEGARLFRDDAPGVDGCARDEDHPQQVECDLAVCKEIVDSFEVLCVVEPDVVEEEIEVR